MAIVLPKLPRIRTPARTAEVAPPALTVGLCRQDGRYEVGQPLRAYWRVGKPAIDEVTGLEASVLWFTEGKGDEDLKVHHFVRWNEAQLHQLDLSIPHSIACILPLSPVSYEGTLLRIRWCVRARLFRTGGRETVAQQPFHLVGTGRLFDTGHHFGADVVTATQRTL